MSASATEAFWLYPDWSGGDNVRSGAQPFWMLEPLYPKEPEMAPRADLAVCARCFRFPGDCDCTTLARPAPEPMGTRYRPQPRPERRPLLCRLGLHKHESYALEPWLFECVRCGDKRDSSFVDEVGVRVYCASNTYDCECGCPFECTDRASCPRAGDAARAG